MGTVHFKSATGGETVTVEIEDGRSLLEASRQGDVDEVVGECLGCAMCATCHVYVDPAWVDRVPALGDQEDSLLDTTMSTREANSRLACQIRMTPEIDGIVVTPAPEQ